MIKISSKVPDYHKYYPVRAGNDLKSLKEWISWAKKNYPEQKLIIVDNYKIRIADKEHSDYWKFRFKAGHEDKYIVYGSYE